MCGIVGYVGREQAAPILLEGLSKLEYQLMEVLMLNQGIYLSSEDLLIKVWGYETEAELGSVWVYISYLRKHIKSLGAQVEIRARRGVGYSLEQTP